MMKADSIVMPVGLEPASSEVMFRGKAGRRLSHVPSRKSSREYIR